MVCASRRYAIAVLEMWWRDGPWSYEECGLGTGREQPGHGCRSLDRDKEDLGIRMPQVRRSRALRAAVTGSPLKSPFHPCTGGRPQVDHTRRGRIAAEAASGEAFRRLPAQLSLSNFLSQTAQTESLDWTGGDFSYECKERIATLSLFADSARRSLRSRRPRSKLLRQFVASDDTPSRRAGRVVLSTPHLG